MMVIRTNDPRLTTPQCFSLDPVKAIVEGIVLHGFKELDSLFIRG